MCLQTAAAEVDVGLTNKATAHNAEITYCLHFSLRQLRNALSTGLLSQIVTPFITL